MKTHWKKLHNPNYFGAYVFDENRADIIDMIVSIGREEVRGAGGSVSECTVAKLKYNKPAIINNTNSKTITKLADSPFIEDWPNTWIQMYITKEKSRQTGEIIDVWRVRTRPPVFNDKHPAYADAVKAVKEGKRTKEQIKAAFNASDAVIDKL